MPQFESRAQQFLKRQLHLCQISLPISSFFRHSGNVSRRESKVLGRVLLNPDSGQRVVMVLDMCKQSILENSYVVFQRVVEKVYRHALTSVVLCKSGVE